jgi:hypothetical protein
MADEKVFLRIRNREWAVLDSENVEEALKRIAAGGIDVSTAEIIHWGIDGRSRTTDAKRFVKARKKHWWSIFD